jgi:hypothetical protein
VAVGRSSMRVVAAACLALLSALLMAPAPATAGAFRAASVVDGPPRALVEEPLTPVVARSGLLGWRAEVDGQYGGGLWRTWIERVDLEVDGTLVETRSGTWCPGEHGCDEAGHLGRLYGVFSYTAAPGRHTVTLRVTDSLGEVGTHTRELVVDGGVRVGRPTLDGRALSAGARLSALVSHDLAVTVAPVTPGAAIRQATLELDGHVVDQYSCATDYAICPTSGLRLAGSGALERSATGARELTLTVEMTSGGAPYVTRWPLRVHPAAALTRTLSARVVRPGQKVTVSGVLRRSDTNAPVAGRPVSIQWAADGTQRWRTVATRTTGARGAFSARLVPPQRGRYRVVHVERAGVLGPGASAPVAVTVAPRVTARLADSSVRRNQATALAISVRPVVRGTTVWVQRQLPNGRWRNETSARLSSTGRATALVAYRSGTHRLRVALPRTARYGPAVSNPVRLRVR